MIEENTTISTSDTAATLNSEETNPETKTGTNPHDQQRNLDVIKEDILHCQENYAQSYLKIGRLLLEAKSIFGKHGDWIQWLQENVDISITKAQRLMRVAETFSNKAPVPFLDYSKAYILTALPERDIEAFVKNAYNVGSNRPKYVKDMTKRELESVVRNYLKSRRIKSAAPLSTTDSKDNLGNETGQNSPGIDFATRIESIKNYMEELVELIGEQVDDLNTREALAAELRELCNDNIQKLPSEELDSM